MEHLNKNGFVIFKNIITNNELNYGLSSIKNNLIDYNIIKTFIDIIFFEKVKKILFWNDPHYLKFRFSNMQNATDASAFHGDIYNHTNQSIIPIFTCLCYFDNAEMEIIPKSHIKSAPFQYNNKQQINVGAGDVLIFHANLHHRGLFYNAGENRRLLQIFEVFPDNAVYTQHVPKVITVLSNNTAGNNFNNLNYQISKNNTIINIVAFIHYFFMFYDFQYRIGFIDIPQETKKNNYVGYEPGIRDVIKNELQPWNINIINDSNHKLITSTFDTNSFLIVLITFIIIVYFLRVGKFDF